jgi:hypothetical protein
MLRTLIVAVVLCGGLLVTNPAGAARAGTIGMVLGAASDQSPYYWPARSGVSCGEGQRIVASGGFRKVRPLDCHGNEYTYRGVRNDGLYKITLRPSSGRIEDVDRIRNWDPYGWSGDYSGEDYSDRGYGYSADGFASGDYGAGFDDDVDW